eukprot:scaffold100299_cov35-Tisochrysis_lutea.AAC.1
MTIGHRCHECSPDGHGRGPLQLELLLAGTVIQLPEYLDLDIGYDDANHEEHDDCDDNIKSDSVPSLWVPEGADH